jgi:DNA-binding transcriptional regulator YhcF (GntR family)
MNPTDYFVYGYLRKFMNKDTYQTLVSLRKLANLVDVSINTVQASIKKLKEAGEIKVLEEKKMVEVIYMKYRKAVNILNDLLLNF